MVRRTDCIELQNSIEVSEAIQYHDCKARKLNNPETSPKTYWAILKTFYNGS